MSNKGNRELQSYKLDKNTGGHASKTQTLAYMPRKPQKSVVQVV